MKLKIANIQKLILTTFLFCTIQLQAQVTIGSGLEPEDGSLLQLKETDNAGVNATKGLVLPRVGLTDLNSLYPMFSGDTDYENNLNNKRTIEDENHVGLTVYNVNSDLCTEVYPGTYVWNGTNWDLIKEGVFPAEVDVLIDNRNPYSPVEYKIGKFGDGGWWMLENLRADRWPDGSKEGIYMSPPKSEAISPPHSKLHSAMYWYASADRCVFEAHPEYGYTYSGYAALRTTREEMRQLKNTTGIQGICPPGWHVPTRADWYALGLAVYNNPCQYAHSTINANVGYNITSMDANADGKSRTPKQGGFNAPILGYTWRYVNENTNPNYELVTGEKEVFPIVRAPELGVYWLSDTTTDDVPEIVPGITGVVSGFTGIINRNGIAIGDASVPSSTVHYDSQVYVRCKKN